MNSHVRDCLATIDEVLIPALTLPDPNDHHVLAAAIRSGSHVIVTHHRKDFPVEVLVQVDFDLARRCHVRKDGTGVSSPAREQELRPLSLQERLQLAAVATFLASASQDEITERLLVPLFQRLGLRVASAAACRRRYDVGSVTADLRSARHVLVL